MLPGMPRYRSKSEGSGGHVLQDVREVQQIMIPRCLYDGVEEVITS